MESEDVEKEDHVKEKGTSNTSKIKEDPAVHISVAVIGKMNTMKQQVTANRHLEEKGKEELEIRSRCKICLNADLCMVFFPCRHVVACEACSDRLKTCAVCRALIRGSVKID
ncbi:baculoviral IAP repeat-containing protein 7-like [Mercenaria mercenaria]|uniref:baculoviral IAP repeat-containing protein 7-like n=1 Tax=Mercenaria mercenaria TaxID=6596 RepID=UPI00234E7804|nr:baculoviral IAP repeat-containing protein 7-like [Mercenaria mercenaria]